MFYVELIKTKKIFFNQVKFMLTVLCKLLVASSTSHLYDTVVNTTMFQIHGEVFIGSVTVLQFHKKFAALYGIKMYITIFPRANHLSIPSTRWQCSKQVNDTPQQELEDWGLWSPSENFATEKAQLYTTYAWSAITYCLFGLRVFHPPPATSSQLPVHCVQQSQLNH